MRLLMLLLLAVSTADATWNRGSSRRWNWRRAPAPAPVPQPPSRTWNWGKAPAPQSQKKCYTTWVKGSYGTCFGSLSGCYRGRNGEWGWTNRIRTGTHQLDMWSEATQCQTWRGRKTGRVQVHTTGYGVTVDIVMASGYEVKQAAMWIGQRQLPQKGYRYTTEQEHFPHRVHRSGRHSFRFRYRMPATLYFAMYAEVCEEPVSTPVPAPVRTPAPATSECVEAWAKGNYATCFRGMRNCWRDQSGVLGWSNKVRLGSEYASLLAGSRNCYAHGTTNVGQVKVDVDSYGVAVTLDVAGGWALQKASMWIGSGMLPVKSHRYSANPAHFPFSTYREGVHKFQFRSYATTCLYYAVHVKVCRENTPAPTALPTPVPRTRTPRTPVPRTPVPRTPVPRTPVPRTWAPPTSAPPTRAPRTFAPPTGAPPTRAPRTGAPPTNAPPTNAPRTRAPRTSAPPTNAPPTSAPPTSAPPTNAPPTNAPPTSAPPTRAPRTRAPRTSAPPTSAPPTNAPPTNAPPTSAPPTNAPPTNAPPTNAPPTSAPPTNAPPTSAPPTSAPPTNAPPTSAPATNAPPTSAPRTDAPPTSAPPTNAPPTNAPPTSAPPTNSPPTSAPPTGAPPTLEPTEAPCVDTDEKPDVSLVLPRGGIVDFGEGVPAEEGMQGWYVNGEQVLLGNLPPVLVLREGVEGHFPPEGEAPIEVGSRLRIECPENCDGTPCEVVIVVYHCLPCSEETDGRLETILPPAGWEAGDCAPSFKTSLTSEDEHETVAYRKVIPAGTTEITPPLRRVLDNTGVFVRQGSSDCKKHNDQQSCDATSECMWTGIPGLPIPGTCESTWCLTALADAPGGCTTPSDCPTPVPAPECKCL